MSEIRKVLPWFLLYVLVWGWEWSYENNTRAHKYEIQKIQESLHLEGEKQKMAMSKQGIWYYRTTVLGQTLPQEEVKVK